MQISFVPYVHSNLPVLEAVVEDMPEVNDIVCAGEVE